MSLNIPSPTHNNQLMPLHAYTSVHFTTMRQGVRCVGRRRMSRLGTRTPPIEQILCDPCEWKWMWQLL